MPCWKWARARLCVCVGIAMCWTLDLSVRRVYQMANTQYFMWSTFMSRGTRKRRARKKWKRKKCDGSGCEIDTRPESDHTHTPGRRKKKRNLSRSVSQSLNWRLSFSCWMAESTPVYRAVERVSISTARHGWPNRKVYSFRSNRRKI